MKYHFQRDNFNFSILVLFVLISGINNPLSANNTEFPLKRICDSILALNVDKQVTLVEVTKTKPIYVYAITCKTLSFPLESIRNVLCDLDQYKFISMIKRIDSLGLEPGGSQRPVYFMEATVSFLAAALYVGYFDTSGIDPQSGCDIRSEHYVDSTLYRKCRERVNALMKIEPRDYLIGWRLRSIDKSTTRVELISHLSLNMWVPDWLYNLAARHLYPGIIQDLEKYMQNGASSRVLKHLSPSTMSSTN
jgi:hypothetical protein